MKSLRILWAKADFLPLRLGLSRLVAPVWPKGEDGGDVLTGRLSLNPANGAPFRGLRPAGGAGLRGADLVVQAFPSRTRMGPLMPLHYGAPADVAALLTEALPRLLAAGGDVTPTVSLALGRLPQTQEALAAGVFEPTGLKVHAWDKLLLTDRVVLPPPGAPDEAAMRLAADHLRAVFGLTRPAGAGRAGALLIAGAEAQVQLRAHATALGHVVGPAIDPARAPLHTLLEALHDAPSVICADARGVALAGLRVGAAPCPAIILE